MIAAQLTGTISKSVEKKETKFGNAFVFGIETQNKKGMPSHINCIQYAREMPDIEKGTRVYVAGDLDIGEYKGKTTVNLLARNLEVLTTPATTEAMDDDLPF